jgi:hypothetical protein
MATVYHPHFDKVDMELVDTALETMLEIDERILEWHISKDQTPDNLDEFLSIINTQQERIDHIKNLRERLNTTGGVIIE